MSCNADLLLPGVVDLESGPGGLPRLRVRAAGGTAVIYLLGAHVAEFTPDGQAPVLWMSAASIFEDGRPIRGGIPVCWPWFGPHPLGGGRPAHGVARLVSWELRETAQLADGRVRVLLALSIAEAHRAWVSAGLRAELSVTVGRSLELALDTINDGNEPTAFEDALHSYFAVSDCRTALVEGLDGAVFVDKCDGLRRKVQQGPIMFTAETDRVYADRSASVELVDPGSERRLRIAKSGSASTVVWNPWIAKSAAMPDFGDDEWTGMACVETANCGEARRILLPGDRHRTTLSVSVDAAVDPS